MSRSLFQPASLASCKRILPISLIACLPLLGLANCSPTGILVGAAASGGTMAFQERGFARGLQDQGLRARINEAWLKTDYDIFSNVYLQIYDQRVLLTGYLPTQEDRITAVRTVWEQGGIAEVINEIQIGEGPDLLQEGRDLYVEKRLKTELTFDGDVSAVDYSALCVNGTVYLLGVAQSQKELERVIAHARGISYVRAVKSHVRILEPSA